MIESCGTLVRLYFYSGLTQKDKTVGARLSTRFQYVDSMCKKEQESGGKTNQADSEETVPPVVGLVSRGSRSEEPEGASSEEDQDVEYVQLLLLLQSDALLPSPHLLFNFYPFLKLYNSSSPFPRLLPLSSAQFLHLLLSPSPPQFQPCNANVIP